MHNRRTPPAGEGVELVISWGLGGDSTAHLVKMLEDPAAHGVDLARTMVLHELTGSEWPTTRAHAEQFVLPLLCEHRVRLVQVSRAMRELIAERAWLTVFLLPAYAPDLNPVEWVWAHVKRSLANLAVVALDRLEALVRNRLKRLQYRPGTLDGFIAGTGLTLDDPASP
ncbi:transposase [Streptomyces sp. M2CJ-2]|uniref:transposase n=1 Tax=Streptomyces sp. M2CJ-2 TaxID=2803948 RepID=UPI001F15FEBF|nr:transposase [Streptomyces sp. M2CJ-2]